MAIITFLFSGRGAQVPGMGQDFYNKSRAAKEIFDTADKVLERSISGLCFNGTQEELNLMHNTQPCMLAADVISVEDAFWLVHFRADAMQEAVPVKQGSWWLL